MQRPTAPQFTIELIALGLALLGALALPLGALGAAAVASGVTAPEPVPATSSAPSQACVQHARTDAEGCS